MNKLPFAVDIDMKTYPYATPEKACEILRECQGNKDWDHSIFPEIDKIAWNECKVVYTLLAYPMMPYRAPLFDPTDARNKSSAWVRGSYDIIYPHLLVDPTGSRYVMGYGIESKLIVVWLQEDIYRQWREVSQL